MVAVAVVVLVLVPVLVCVNVLVFTFSTSERPKVVRDRQFLALLTCERASRHNGVHFFDIATSKSAPDVVFYKFWLRDVLRATAACSFSTSQLPTALWRWGAFNILTSRCASRHNGVHFLNNETSKSVPFWLWNVLRAIAACLCLSLISLMAPHP